MNNFLAFQISKSLITKFLAYFEVQTLMGKASQPITGSFGNGMADGLTASYELLA